MVYKTDIESGDALWQMVVRSLGEVANVQTLHPYDEQRIVQLCCELVALGERPDLATVRSFCRDVWEGDHAGEYFTATWAKLARNPHHRFRGQKRDERRLRAYVIPERLSESHGRPPVVEVLASRVEQAAAVYARATGEVKQYETRRDLFAAMEALEDLRKRDDVAASFSRYGQQGYRGRFIERVSIHWPRPE